MKINKLLMQNIGPYVGEHILTFNNMDDRNITLIGGKNGAGKTTIFSSIQLCLYGHKAFGYESVSAAYYKEVYKLINSQLRAKQNDIAKISVQITVDDGKYNNKYDIVRLWEFKSKGIKEVCLIKKNGILLANDELVSFINYLDSLISADLFNFYFFDGERISDYFLSDNSRYNFRKAFLSLCGLDSISLMVQNFERIYKSKNKNDRFSKAYFEARNSLTYKTEELSEASRDLMMAECEEIRLSELLTALELQHSQAGGLGIEEWKELNKTVLAEEQVREAMYKELRDIALNNLPFIIVRKQLDKLLVQITSEEEYNRAEILKTALNNDKIKELLKTNLTTGVNVESVIEQIYKRVSQGMVHGTNFNEILMLSTEESHRLQGLIAEKSKFSSNTIINKNRAIRKSRKISEKARISLSLNNLDRMSEFLEKKNRISAEISDVVTDILQRKKEVEILRAHVEQLEIAFFKATKEFEQELKNNSMVDMSSKLVLVYKDIEEKLILRYANLLQDKFITNFKSLINKDGFIDGIDVDMQLNVRPYKYIELDRNEFVKLYDKVGKEHFIDEVGVRSEKDILVALNNQSSKVRLPIIIKTEFSKGEKQVYIMALYLSLLQLAKSNVPFIIDTPFARIDSEHRSKIIDHFFKKIDAQVIILSTDEEIVGKVAEQINDRVGSEILLESLEHGSTRAIQDKYFEVKYGI